MTPEMTAATTPAQLRVAVQVGEGTTLLLTAQAHAQRAHCLQSRKLRHTSRHHESYKLRPNKQHLLQTCVTCSYLGQCLLVTALHREHSRHITDSNRAAPAAAAASTAASAATAATLLHSLCRWQP
jgi:hypothetical protein